MQGLLRIAAVGSFLAGIVDAKAVKWSRDENEEKWLPARETLGMMALLAGGISPAPTPAPGLPSREQLEKRGATDNTCAYVSGSSGYPLYCATDSGCATNSIYSAFGCCPDVSTASTDICQIWTTCFASSQASLYTTNNGRTLWCGQSSYPNCVRHTFADSRFAGYYLWGCGKTSTTGLVYFLPTDTSSSRPSTPTTTPRTTSTRSTSTITSSDTTTPGGASFTVPPSGQNSGGGAQASSSGSSTNIGAIVGGVVGGVAGLALIGLAIFLIFRRSKKNGAEQPLQQNPNGAGPPSGPAPYGAAAAAAAPYPGGPGSPKQQGAPHMQQMAPPPDIQQQQQNGGYAPYGQTGFAPVAAIGAATPDPRHSTAKPHYSVASSMYDPSLGPPSAVSPPQSPAPAYQYATTPPPQQPSPNWSQGGEGYPTPDAAAVVAGYPPPLHQQHNGGYGQPQQQQQQPQQQRGYASELPAARGDGELRELA